MCIQSRHSCSKLVPASAARTSAWLWTKSAVPTLVRGAAGAVLECGVPLGLVACSPAAQMDRCVGGQC